MDNLFSNPNHFSLSGLPSTLCRQRRFTAAWQFTRQLRGQCDQAALQQQASNLLFQPINSGRARIRERLCDQRIATKLSGLAGDRERIFGSLRGSEGCAVNLILLHFVTQYSLTDFEQLRRLAAPAPRFSKRFTHEILLVGFD